MIINLRSKCDCEGCSNIYCTKYCQANGWPKHKKICNQSSTAEKANSIYQLNKCGKCAKTNDLKVCSRCHKTSYCCKSCQKADWKNHKNICRDLENSNNLNIETKIEIELKLNEISSQQNKRFRKTMSTGITFTEGNVSALFYDDFVDLRMYKAARNGSWDKAINYSKNTYPDYSLLLEMNKVPDEHGAVAAKQLLIAYIPRYHHYRGRHCVYIEDVQKVELYIAFYFDREQSETFNWDEVRPGRFIIIFNPKIHHFNDTSVGFRLEGPVSFQILDV